MLLVLSLPGENLGKVCENSRAGETLDCVSGFHWCALEFYQTFTSYESTENVLFLKWKHSIVLREKRTW